MEKTGKHAIIIAISIIAVSVFIAAVLLNGGNYNQGTGSAHSGESSGTTQINRVIPAGHITMNILSPIDHFVINATVPEMPLTVPYYKDTYQRSDVVDLRYNATSKVRPNVTSESAAPILAQQVLAPYGGLPSDAVMIYSKTSYMVTFNGTTGEVKRREPVETTVLYERNLNGSTIKGMHDMAYVTFGDDGEILKLRRIWGTIQYSGRDIPIISVYDAIRKLEERDIMNPVLDGAEVTINATHLGHYGYKWTNSSHETYLEPIWVFTGTFPAGDYYEFYVYARQFANFTATPAAGITPLTVVFNDTSDASPTKWRWDFGDGTNSTVQNATHVYTASGTYNVTLTVWNDLGSDTMTKTGFIQVSLPTLIANFTATPATGGATLPVQFTDTSSASANRWYWDFGDGTNSTGQNVAHTYASPGTYSVTHQVWNNYGNDTISRQYLVNNRSSMLYPNTKYLEYSTVLANTSYYAVINGVEWHNDHFFGVVGNGHYNFSLSNNEAYVWNQSTQYSNRYYMDKFRKGTTYYPANLSRLAYYQWVFAEGLSPTSYTSYNDDPGGRLFRELGGYVNYGVDDTFYLWYGNTTAACDNNGWLFPTYENATYIVKIDVIWR